MTLAAGLEGLTGWVPCMVFAFCQVFHPICSAHSCTRLIFVLFPVLRGSVLRVELRGAHGMHMQTSLLHLAPVDIYMSGCAAVRAKRRAVSVLARRWGWG